MIRRPPRSTLSSSSAASDVYKRQVGFSGVVARRLIGGLVRQERTTLLHSGASASNVDVTFLGTKASCQLHEVVERMRVGERLDARRLPGGGAHQDSLDGHLEHLPGERARHLG